MTVLDDKTLKTSFKLMAALIVLLLVIEFAFVKSENVYKMVTVEGHEYIAVSREPWIGTVAHIHKADCKAH